MSPHDWQLPVRCPRCESESGAPFKVQSKTSGEVTVALRCSRCDHEWSIRRATPLFVIKPDRRDPSGDVK
jgi:predicted Zn-ribbon and HTH transcriptional regulator